MRHGVPVAILSLALFSPRPASGQDAGQLELGVVGLWHNKTVLVDGLRGFGGGARLGIWLPLNFSLEGEADLTTLTNWAPPSARFVLLHASASLLYNVPIGGGSIYFRGGYGKLRTSGACQIHSLPCPTFGAATGAAGFRVPLGSAVSLRGEGMVRNRTTYDYTSFGASLGLAVMPGGGGRGSSLDTDRDGVADRRDRCPETPLGALVDSRGCPTDHDGDGVFDGLDRCPQTPPGTTVDAFGCAARDPLDAGDQPAG